MTGLVSFLAAALCLFTIGIVGALTRRSAILVFLSIELMLNAANLVFLAFARYLGQLNGIAFVFFILAVSAAEAAVGVAIVVAFIRRRRTTNLDAANLMKW
ncbi:MAG: NADH-quinone oxidoreductase subunit NuoK [Acidobacteriota bacterium]|jgi:NADH-quinone oxidoreductase subunit K